MIREEYEDIKLKIIKRKKLEQYYLTCELEKFIEFGLLPRLPADPIYCAIMDFLAYRTDIARENILRQVI